MCDLNFCVLNLVALLVCSISLTNLYFVPWKRFLYLTEEPFLHARSSFDDTVVGGKLF